MARPKRSKKAWNTARILVLLLITVRSALLTSGKPRAKRDSQIIDTETFRLVED